MSTLGIVTGGYTWDNDGGADDNDVGDEFGVSPFSFVVVIVVVGDGGWWTVFLSGEIIVFRHPLLRPDGSRWRDVEGLVRVLSAPLTG